MRESGVQEGLVPRQRDAHHRQRVHQRRRAGPARTTTRSGWKQLAPFDASPQRYHHNRTGEDNADAHLKRQIMGREVVVAITEGQARLRPVGADLLRRVRRPPAEAGAGEGDRGVGVGEQICDVCRRKRVLVTVTRGFQKWQSTTRFESGSPKSPKSSCAEGVATESTLRGCSAQEMDEIQTDVGLTLPLAYREFLCKMGREAGKFYVGSDIFYPRLLGITEAAHSLVAENPSGISLPEDAIAFIMHQGYQFIFIRANEATTLLSTTIWNKVENS